MDVVKKAIDSLRGSIEIESEKGVGTQITLRLPLTLAIIDGLLVNVDDGFFVLPLTIVEECIELSREDIEKAHGRRLVNLRGQLVPYIRLRETFAIRGRAPDIEQVIIAEANGARMGLAVDQVVGEHQTVIKSLGKTYKDVKGISGAHHHGRRQRGASSRCGRPRGVGPERGGIDGIYILLQRHANP